MPRSVKYSTNELTIDYLLSKNKTVSWDTVKHIIHVYGYRQNYYKVVYNIDGNEKYVSVPGQNKHLQMLETFSKLKVIDQYQYKSIKEKEYKNQFKK